MKLHIYFMAIAALLIGNEALSQSRVPLEDEQIPLPDYSGIFAIDDGKLLELTKPMDDYNSEPNIEVSPMAEFAFKGVGSNRRLVRIMSQEEYNQQVNRRRKLATDYFTWDNWDQLMTMETAAFGKMMNGLAQNEEEIKMKNKLVEGQPTLVRQIPPAALALGDYRIGDGIRWYKIRVVTNPTRESSPSVDVSEATYEVVNYKKLASPAFIKEFDKKRVQFDAMFLGEWSGISVYQTFKIATSGKVFISHRQVGYVASETGLGSSDLEIPPFAISMPKERSDIIYEMERGDTFTVKGLAQKYEGVMGMYQGIEVLAESVEKK